MFTRDITSKPSEFVVAIFLFKEKDSSFVSSLEKYLDIITF